MGNLYFAEEKDSIRIDRDLTRSLDTLGEIIDTTAYLTDTSDIVSLMVLEHQIAVHNAIISASMNTRRWIHMSRALSKHWDEPTNELSESTLRLIDNQAKTLLDLMLFKDEIQLEGWGVEGGKAFRQAFESRGKKTNAGSLRDLNLMSRLFKNRLSYMIYSESFKALPQELLESFHQKLSTVLAGKGAPENYGYLKEAERKRILAILEASKNDLPQNWTKAAAVGS